MEKNLVIKKTAAHMKKLLSGEGSGHDWWHTYRVWKDAIRIGKQEKADLFIVQLTALLHDIADYKLHGGDENIGPRRAREWLEGQKVDEKTISQVCRIISDMPFKGAKVESKMKALEGKVVQDADRLDAIGAIGIARCFTFSGHKGREIYNPDIKPDMHESFEQYKSNVSPAINHFYEKLLLLKDLMNTKAARKIAEGRHVFMKQYLNRFYKEWEGKD
jgi:uncharacterized protein